MPRKRNKRSAVNSLPVATGGGPEIKRNKLNKTRTVVNTESKVVAPSSVGYAIKVRQSKDVTNSAVVSKEVRAATKRVYQMWMGKVDRKKEKVWDMKFISPHKLCCILDTAIHMYTFKGRPRSFRLLQQTQLDEMHSFHGVAVAGDSLIYLTCATHCTVHQYETSTDCLIPHTGQWRNNMINNPRGIAVSQDGIIAVADLRPGNVYLYRKDGSHVMTLGAATDGTIPRDPSFDEPTFLTWDKTGRLLVSDYNRHCIFVFTNGQLTATIGIPGEKGHADDHLNSPFAVCVDHQNNILVAEWCNERLSKFDSQGKCLCHPLRGKLEHVKSDLRYVDVADQGDRELLLVGNISGDMKLFRI